MGGESKHTPGPWIAISESADTVQNVYAKGSHIHPIAKVTSYWTDNGPARDERDANARLIAAAPDYAWAAGPLVAVIAHYEPSCGEDDDEEVTVRLGDLRALQRAHAKALHAKAEAR